MKIFILISILTIGCSTPAPVSNTDTLINDTFFYRSDGTYLQYPKTVPIGDSLSNSWFSIDTFSILVEDDKNSSWACDTEIYYNDDEEENNDTEINCGYSNFIILKSYIEPNKSKFKYSKELP